MEFTSVEIKGKMKEDFKGEFIEAKVNGIKFFYSPCLHIKTFRVAETYGQSVLDFKKSLFRKLKQPTGND